MKRSPGINAIVSCKEFAALRDKRLRQREKLSKMPAKAVVLRCKAQNRVTQNFLRRHGCIINQFTLLEIWHHSKMFTKLLGSAENAKKILIIEAELTPQITRKKNARNAVSDKRLKRGENGEKRVRNSPRMATCLRRKVSNRLLSKRQSVATDTSARRGERTAAAGRLGRQPS